MRAVQGGRVRAACRQCACRIKPQRRFPAWRDNPIPSGIADNIHAALDGQGSILKRLNDGNKRQARVQPLIADGVPLTMSRFAPKPPLQLPVCVMTICTPFAAGGTTGGTTGGTVPTHVPRKTMLTVFSNDTPTCYSFAVSQRKTPYTIRKIL